MRGDMTGMGSRTERGKLNGRGKPFRRLTPVYGLAGMVSGLTGLYLWSMRHINFIQRLFQ